MGFSASLAAVLTPLLLAGGAPAQEAGETLTRVPDRSEAQQAVRAGVAWLVRHQQADGSWHGSRRGAQDIGTTGLAVLALGKAGGEPAARERGLAWLVAQQDEETGLIGEHSGHDFHYGHAIAALALCRAVDGPELTPLREAAQRAVDYILRARNPHAVWRYDMPPTGENDTSVTGWMVGALRAGEETGLVVERAVYEDCLRWLDAVTDTETGRVGYDSMGSGSSRVMRVNDHYPPESGEAMTAIGLTLRVELGQSPERHAILTHHADLLLRCPPAWDPEGLGTDLYYWYHGTEALALVGGEHWLTWRAALTDAVVGAQHTQGDDAGSWDPVGPWCYAGGRAYATALLTSCLSACLE